MKAYFENIEFEIKSEILKAQDSISIAVSWINNEVLFESIRSKLGTTKIKLLFENDSNNKKGGLNFQEFIDLGGELFYLNENKLMHNKFCIIDDKILLNGSYNWTYVAEYRNYENIIKTSDLKIVNKFIDEFNCLEKRSNSIVNYKKECNNESDKTSFIYEKKVLSSEFSFDVNEVASQIIEYYHQNEFRKGLELFRKFENQKESWLEGKFNLAGVVILLANGYESEASKLCNDRLQRKINFRDMKMAISLGMRVYTKRSI